MKPKRIAFAITVAGVVGLALAGCTTTQQHPVKHFEPQPLGKMRPEEPPAAVDAQTVTDLLKEAQKEFEAANVSQEQKDKDGALKHYTKMLELIGKANLDPAVFYNLRSEFERILNSSEHQTRLFEKPPFEVKLRDINAPVVGDLQIEFPLPDRVLAEIEEIQTGYPKPFQEGLDRSYKFLPYIRAEFAKAGIPTDLAWLAMVESEYCSKCISRAGAVGMWQFMRGTAVNYNVRMDDYVDERYDWKKSTAAAITYLKELSERFGHDWSLATAAYNMGENGLERAIASTGGEKNFWKLIETPPASDCIQQETKKYYPRLLATILVAKDPEKFGFKANPQPAEDSVVLPIQGSYSLAALDRACGLQEGTLQKLNPHLVRGITPANGKANFFVPPDAGATLMAALENVPQVRPEVMFAAVRKPDPKPEPKAEKETTYTVKRGDSLDQIAEKFKVSEDRIKKANRIQTAKLITPGRKLVIPAEENEGSARDSDNAAKDKKDAQKKQENKGRVYTVKKGESLADIAKSHKISIKDLLKWNKKKSPQIAPGDKLVLTPLEEMAEEVEQHEKTHVVKPGECADKIARLYGVNLEDLIEWNHLKKDATVIEGEKLIIRGQKDVETPKKDEKAKAEAPPVETSYTVAKGDTTSGIAEKNGVALKDLLAWNKLTEKSFLQIGQKLTVKSVKLAKVEPSDAKPAAKQEKTETKAAKEPVKEEKKAAAKEEPKKAEKPAADAKKTEPAPEKKETKTAKTAETPKTEEKKPEAKTKVAKADAPAPKAAAKPAPKEKKLEHVVKPGECPEGIAAKYGVNENDLFKWNNWSKKTVIQPGDKVTVFKKQ